MTEYKRFCSKCGARVEPGDAFCANCGAKLEPAASADPASGGAVSMGTSGGPASGSAGEKAGKKSALSKAISFIAIIGVLYLIFGDMLPGSKNGPATNYAEAGARAMAQLENHDAQISAAFNIPKFEEELSAYKPSKIALELMGSDVMIRLYSAASRYDGNPRHGERMALTAYPETISTYLNKSTSGDFSTLRLTLSMKYFTTKAQEDELQKRVKEILDGMRLEGKSDYEKVRAIYNYICANVTYDYAHLGDQSYLPQYTAYAALFDRTAVCSGVAELFSVMATAAGVEAHIKTSATHAWNFVKLGGKYYYLDATWDLGVPEAQYQYFLKGKSDFVLNNVEISHRYSIIYSPYGFDGVLYDTDKGYPFSDYAYGA